MFLWLVLPIILLLIALVAGIFYLSARKKVNAHLAKSEGGEPDHMVRPERGYRESETRTEYGEAVVQKRVAGWITVACIGLVIFIEFLCSFAIVGTKEVGVVTAFNKPVGKVSSGLHMLWPWQEVTELDAAIQTDSKVDDKKADVCTSTSVRLANQSTACVDNSIRWRIKPEAADELFQNYRTFANIRDSLVTRELNTALNEVMSHFNPLATLITGQQGNDEKNGEIVNLDLTQLAKEVQEKVESEIGREIEVKSVFIPFVGYDPKTQEKINLYQAALANTKIATQEEKTALHEAQTNKNLANSVSHDPNVLVSKCIGILDDMVKAGRPVPAGFSCWPNGGTGIVIPATGR